MEAYACHLVDCKSKLTDDEEPKNSKLVNLELMKMVRRKNNWIPGSTSCSGAYTEGLGACVVAPVRPTSRQLNVLFSSELAVYCLVRDVTRKGRAFGYGCDACAVMCCNGI